ncbi:MAG: hypothetical protein ACJAYU_003016 [Bradymonadia bacterium]|jgi:hypothetical protein
MILSADSLLVAAGAELGVDSGLPEFRDRSLLQVDGSWASLRPARFRAVTHAVESLGRSWTLSLPIWGAGIATEDRTLNPAVADGFARPH